MRAFPLIAVAILSITFSGHVILAQDDLSRDNDLPSRIGVPQCANMAAGRDASLQGSLTVRGAGVDSIKKLELMVTGSGMPVGRKQLRNGGAFTFNCVPKENVMLSVYINGSEFQTMSLGNLMGQPYMNRQDLVVTYSESHQTPSRASVVTTDDLYKRSAANAKLFSEAVSQTQKGNSENANKILRQILAADPGDYVARTQLANFEFNAGHFEQAVAEYVASLDSSPAYLPALIGLGRSNIALRRYDEAVRSLEKAVASEPNSADAHQYLGEAYLDLKKGSLAVPQMRAAMELEPVKKAALHLRLASLYNAAGARDLAVQECRLYLQALPDAPDRAKVQKYIDENTTK